MLTLYHCNSISRQNITKLLLCFRSKATVSNIYILKKDLLLQAWVKMTHKHTLSHVLKKTKKTPQSPAPHAAPGSWLSCSHSARWLPMADCINVASASVDMGTLQWYFGAVCFCWVSKPGHSEQQAVWPGLVCVCMCVSVSVCMCV